MNKIYLISILLLLNFNAAFAKDDDGKTLSQQGVLASSIGSAGNVDVSIPDTWGGVKIEGKSGAPITAGVIKKSDTLWDLKAENVSSDEYKFTLELIQFSKDGKKIKNVVLPFLLKPKTSKAIPVTVSSFAQDYVVNILSWKKIENKKNKKEKVDTKVNIKKDKNDEISDKELDLTDEERELLGVGRSGYKSITP